MRKYVVAGLAAASVLTFAAPSASADQGCPADALGGQGGRGAGVRAFMELGGTGAELGGILGGAGGFGSAVQIACMRGPGSF